MAGPYNLGSGPLAAGGMAVAWEELLDLYPWGDGMIEGYQVGIAVLLGGAENYDKVLLGVVG